MLNGGKIIGNVKRVESDRVPEKVSCGGRFRAWTYEDRRVKSIMCGSREVEIDRRE